MDDLYPIEVYSFVINDFGYDGRKSRELKIKFQYSE